MVRRRLSKRRVWFLIGIFAVPLFAYAIWKAHTNHERMESIARPVRSPISSSSPSYRLDLDGEDGFWEYHKSIGYKGSRESALDAGYRTCYSIRVAGSKLTYEQLRITSKNKQDADRLMYASVHYLCSDLTGR